MDKKYIIASAAISSAFGCLAIVGYILIIACVVFKTNDVILNGMSISENDLSILVPLGMMLLGIAMLCDPDKMTARKRQKKLTSVSDEEYSIMASRQYEIPQDYAIAVKRYFETEFDMPMPWLVPEMTLSQIDYYCPDSEFIMSDFLMLNDIMKCHNLNNVNINMTVGEYARVMFDQGVCFDEFRTKA